MMSGHARTHRADGKRPWEPRAGTALSIRTTKRHRRFPKAPSPSKAYPSHSLPHHSKWQLHFQWSSHIHRKHHGPNTWHLSLNCYRCLLAGPRFHSCSLYSQSSAHSRGSHHQILHPKPFSPVLPHQNIIQISVSCRANNLSTFASGFPRKLKFLLPPRPGLLPDGISGSLGPDPFPHHSW